MSEEEIIESVKYHILLEYNGFCNIDKVSLQGLLDLYQKEKEKNKELEKKYKEKNKLLKTYKGNLPKNVELICLCKDDFERNISTDYISKDKIREQIKGLKNIIEFRKPTYEDCLKYTIDILEDLLEENKSDENNI